MKSEDFKSTKRALSEPIECQLAILVQRLLSTHALLHTIVLAKTLTSNIALAHRDSPMSTTLKARREYIPTPEEISRMTDKIRKTWTPQVRTARRRMAQVYQSVLISNNDRSAA